MEEIPMEELQIVPAEVVEPIIDDVIEEPVVPQFTKEEIEAKLIELNAVKAELDGKFYLVEGGKAYGEKLRSWLINDAKWNYSEAVAICKLEKAVGDALKKIEIGETKGNFYMLGIEMKALNMIFTKYDGKGYHSAAKFKEVLMPIIDILSTTVLQDEQLLDRVKFQIASWTQGVEPVPEVNL